ncbi:MAG: hypothetical protein DRO23_08905, partial [Thermoprotei archaeon]
MASIPSIMRYDVARAREILSEANTVTLVYHDDADGVCSAALAVLGLDKLKVNVKRKVCLEKLFPQAIEAIHSKQKENDIIMYVDLGSPHTGKIAEKIRGEKVIIIDHHDPQKVVHKNIVHINPELYGLTGERDASASTMVYLFFRLISPEIQSYSFLAIIGSAEIPGPLISLNSIPLTDAMNVGKVR